MTQDKSLSHRGTIQAIAGSGSVAVFVTIHPESRPTAVYRLNLETDKLDAVDLPCGAQAVVIDTTEKVIWAAGSDKYLYRLPLQGGAARAVDHALEAPATALALVSRNRLAALCGSQVVIVACDSGRTEQAISLPAEGTALTANADGQWLVVGCGDGQVAVYQSEEQDEFIVSETDRLHQGAVTALCFEPEELRFFSAGRDGKLLQTQARGRLEPEDRGRSFNHSEPIVAIILGSGDRILTAAGDQSIKAWTRGDKTRPQTATDGLVKIIGMALLNVHKKPRLAVACDDQTIRTFAIIEEGRVGELLARYHDAYDSAKDKLAQSEPKVREQALRDLASHGDRAALELLNKHLDQESDHSLRLLAAQLISASDHPRAGRLLEARLKHSDEAVRREALSGLRRHRGTSDLGVLDLALKSGKSDIGIAAVQALGELAAADELAFTALRQSLNHNQADVRTAALFALERLPSADPAEGDLTGLSSKHADVRRLALIRLFQRKLLDHSRVQAFVRSALEDAEAEVRRVALLVTLTARSALTQRLRSLDADLHRQLSELETTSVEFTEDGRLQRPESPPKPGPQPKPSKTALADEDYDPLLQAMASRALDTSLRGALGLALLGDERAFGLLLQLSRSEDAAARASVCRGFRMLGDLRGESRLRALLNDLVPEVRDEAFSTLSHFYENQPLTAAELGLTSQHEDVRQRALKLVSLAARRDKVASVDAPASRILARILDDPAQALRSESLKAGLNLNIAGDVAATLRFLLLSSHADVRRDVLTEVMAQITQPWAEAILFELFHDADAGLRREAFDFAVGRAKRSELGPLEAALGSRHEDIRLAAIEALGKRHTRAAQDVLMRGIADPKPAVRLAAIERLVSDDAVSALRVALTSERDDVRVRAAGALARRGDREILPTLLEVVARPEPEEKERRADWQSLVVSALSALAELGDPSAVDAIRPLMESKHQEIRRAAAQALAPCAWANHADALREAMRQSDTHVKIWAAWGLTLAGDESALHVVFSNDSANILSDRQRLIASWVLGKKSEETLAGHLYLKSPTQPGFGAIQRDTSLLLLMREWKSPGPTPSRLWLALAAAHPRDVLEAARALEAFGDSARLAELATEAVNDRGPAEPWKIDPATISDFAELAVHGSPFVQARTLGLLELFTAEHQSVWDRAWKLHTERFADALTELRRAAEKRKTPKPEDSPEVLKQMAFGTYIGLVREQGPVAGGGQSTRFVTQSFDAGLGKASAAADPEFGRSWNSAGQLARVRETALRRVLAEAKTDARFAKSARPVLVQALGDSHATVRIQAFEHLRELGLPRGELGSAALESGHTDLAVLGLQELAEGTSPDEGRKLIEQVMRSRSDDIAPAALKLLLQIHSPVEVAQAAVEAVSDTVRRRGVEILTEQYDQNPAAQVALRNTLKSRYRETRQLAAERLALKKDPTAFEALSSLLHDAKRERDLPSILDSLQLLGDPRTPALVLDRLENDPEGIVPVPRVFSLVGDFRQEDVADRLLTWLDHPNWAMPAAHALLKIAGFDEATWYERIERSEPEAARRVFGPWTPLGQRIERWDLPERFWTISQPPLREALLARALQRFLDVGPIEPLHRLVLSGIVRLCRTDAVDPLLVQLAVNSDEFLRRASVEVHGWRVRHRGSKPEPLVKLLESADPVCKFLAAEGLAYVGRNEGLSVLQAAVELIEPVQLRQRAVLALGQLADPRSLDLLLRLANEEKHALQESAAEAIGHLGKSEKAEQISQLLLRLARGRDGVAQNALRGLRWLDTRDGWALIRRQAEDDDCWFRETAIDLLSHHDDPATRELLLRLAAKNDEIGEEAFFSARKLFGPDSLEPNYAWVQNPLAEAESEDVQVILKRGDADRLFTLLPNCRDEDIRRAVIRALLAREPLPLAAASQALNASQPWTVSVAAKVLGRAGEAATASRDTLATALTRWSDAWTQELERSRRYLVLAQSGPLSLVDEGDDEPTMHAWTDCLVSLVWACGKHQIAGETIRRLVTAHEDEPTFAPVRRAALEALRPPLWDEAAALETLNQLPDPRLRPVAADLLAEQFPTAASRAAGQLVGDVLSLGRLMRHQPPALNQTLEPLADQISYQGVVLPAIVNSGEMTRLVAILNDKKSQDAVRLGVIEALAKLAREDAEAQLAEFGSRKTEDEDLRKAAWRGRRRSIRARLKIAKVQATAGNEVNR
jgi:ParB family chromosome partitioning protein